MTATPQDARAQFETMGIPFPEKMPAGRIVTSPIDGAELTRIADTRPGDVREIVTRSHAAYRQWRDVPAPQRGELVRRLGDMLREHKEPLGRLVTLEAGKVLSEGLGEVQAMIDICDFAVGLSRQIRGLTLPSERPGHRMMETWHPVGPVAVISAFNFPVAVWSWNAAIALVCGNTIIWKPSEKTPLTAIAVSGLFQRVIAQMDAAPDDLASLVLGDKDVGSTLLDDPRIALISATGSTEMGKQVAPQAAKRFTRTILELGGNNAAIVCPSADMDLALRAVAFSALGTAGQRCTSLRRLFVHESVYSDFISKLKSVYDSAAIGDPRKAETLIGPLIDETAFHTMQSVLAAAHQLGASVHGGGPFDVSASAGGKYVRPALIEMPAQKGPMLDETFAPILYCLPYTELDEAIALQNAAVQGLSSSIFTADLREAEQFLSSAGSDCGIANVNIGTSGAEIGGAFGGEKETGGGRESGSDAWKAYMRRATNTVNYSSQLPLAQGVSFDM